LILATFLFADGNERAADVPNPPPVSIVMEDLPSIPSLRERVPGDLASPLVTRRTFALLEGGPPHRYREVELPAVAPEVAS
jgi:hypothetical protein